MTGMNCTSPSLIEEADLQAYAQGEPLPEIAAHLVDCPACQNKVAEYKQLATNLQSVLWRQDCPPVKQLLDYRAGYLPTKQKAALEAHIEVCPHCQAELHEFTSLEKDESIGDSLWARVEELLSKVPLVVANLVQPVDGMLPALRGEERDVLLFEAGNTAISLTVEPTEDDGIILHGQVLAVRKITGRVRLKAVDQPAIESDLSPTGTFTLTGIPSSHCQLVIDLPEEHIVLPALSIEV